MKQWSVELLRKQIVTETRDVAIEARNAAEPARIAAQAYQSGNLDCWWDQEFSRDKLFVAKTVSELPEDAICYDPEGLEE